MADTQTEWVEGKWGALKIADRVRLIPTDTQAPTIEGYVSNADTPAWLMIRGLGSTQFQAQAYRLYVEAPPKVELPTDEGWYSVVADGSVYARLLRLKAGHWEEVDTDGLYKPTRLADLATRDGRLTRLAPVPETAKKVLERIEEAPHIDGDSRINLTAYLNLLRAEFGVTS